VYPSLRLFRPGSLSQSRWHRGLEIAAAVTANALRARHVQIEGDFFDGEAAEVTTARILAYECDMLCDALSDYCRLVLARLARERDDWPL
jgi:hypothetical protein